MAFTLSRSGNNVPAEVQRWQYFLRKRQIPQTGAIDADFGRNTETGTKIFQIGAGLTAHGRADKRTLEKAQEFGYTIVADNYYKKRAGTSYPKNPSDLSSPGNATRNRDFTCFKFIQRPGRQRPRPESIVQKGSCDGTVRDWASAHIVTIDMPQLQFARGYAGRFNCHKKAARVFTALFEKWEHDDLLHLIRSYAGCFVPRYKAGNAPSPTRGHGEMRSTDVGTLSNHAFGSAFDINAKENWIGEVPALCGQRGAVRELVASANDLGIYWGGHFRRRLDGMHFEISKLRSRR